MKSYVYPGCGYGGYCLPKDTNALLAQSREKGYEPAILKEVIAVNDNMADTISKKIIKALPDERKDACIGILGLAFKPGSDDVRDTPAARIIRKLREKGYDNIIAYDPVAQAEFARVYPELDIEMCPDRKTICEKASVLVITTAWEEFRDIMEETNSKVIDCRYML